MHIFVNILLNSHTSLKKYISNNNNKRKPREENGVLCKASITPIEGFGNRLFLINLFSVFNENTMDYMKEIFFYFHE